MENKRKYISAYVLIGLILLQLGRIVYSFIYLKEDYHPDEAWNFGLSNSYYEPYVYQNADETEFINVDTWFSSDVLKRYLTVDREQRFSYDSVFYNQSKDMHPPLYYLILHTICSFFPESFSYYYGFSINIIVFVILQLMLYKLSREMTKSTFLALLTCTFFGFSSGALSMFVFVRMYALLSLFATVSVLLHTNLFKNTNYRNNLIAAFAVTVAGCLTQHLFLVYAGALSACFCFYYLINREIRKLFIYAATMLSAVVISVLIFPATINHLFGRMDTPVKYTPEWQFKLTLNCFLNEIIGTRVLLGRTIAPVVIIIVIIVIVILSIPLAFLFRKEVWFLNFIECIKHRFNSTCKKYKKLDFRKLNYMPLFIVFSSLAVIIVVSHTVSLPVMAGFTDRYLFVFYPSASAAIVHCFYKIFSVIMKKKASFVVSGICLVCILASNYYYPSLYFFQGDRSVRKCYSGSNIIYVTPENNYYTLTSLADHVLDSEMIYMSTLSDFTDNISFPPEDEIQRPVYLLIDDIYLYEDDSDDENIESGHLYNDFEQLKNGAVKQRLDASYSRKEFERTIKTESVFDKCEYIGQDYICGFAISVYRLR